MILPPPFPWLNIEIRCICFRAASLGSSLAWNGCSKQVCRSLLGYIEQEARMEMNQCCAILGIFVFVMHDSESIFVQSDGDEAYKLLLRQARRSRSDRASSIRFPEFALQSRPYSPATIRVVFNHNLLVLSTPVILIGATIVVVLFDLRFGSRGRWEDVE